MNKIKLYIAWKYDSIFDCDTIALISRDKDKVKKYMKDHNYKNTNPTEYFTDTEY